MVKIDSKDREIRSDNENNKGSS